MKAYSVDSCAPNSVPIPGVHWHTTFHLIYGVQWSTKNLCRRSSRRPLISQLPTSSLARKSVRTSWHSLRQILNVEIWSVGRADFERSGLHAREWEKVAGPGLCISGATKHSRFF